jgi:hypothetical protein
MPASDQHPDYSKSLPVWQKTRDATEGSPAIKARTQGGESESLWGKAGTRYLPPPNASDTTAENSARYDSYLTRANYVNFTGWTLEGMLGMVYKRPIKFEADPGLTYIEEDSTGGGLTLEQFSKDVVADVLMTGRYGVLVDYPQTGQGLTQAQVEALNLRANMLPYEAEAIINWRTEMIGGVKKLVLLVLAEEHEKYANDGFSFEMVTYHRVLSLVEGVYTQSLYDEEDIQIGESMVPTKADGSTWDEIPFSFVGSRNNDETIDKGPLSDLADVNIAHYRNSADFEESSFMVGQPTPWAAGLSQSWVDEVMKSGVTIGSRAFVLLPEGGSAGLMQANENQMPSKGMGVKEDQMVKIGARIIQDSTGEETAEAARIRFGGQNSQLATIVGNVEAAVVRSLGFAAEFMGSGDKVEFELNKQFYDPSIDPQLIIAGIQMVDRGLIAESDFRGKLRESGFIKHDRTDEDIEAETGNANPLVE